MSEGLPWRPTAGTETMAESVLGGTCWPKSFWRSALVLPQSYRLQDWTSSGKNTNSRKLEYRYTEHGPAREQDLEFPIGSPSLRKLAQSSYPHPSEERQKKQELQSHNLQNKRPQLLNTNENNHMDHSLCNLLKL